MSDCKYFAISEEDGPYCIVDCGCSCFGCENYTPCCENLTLDEDGMEVITE